MPPRKGRRSNKEKNVTKTNRTAARSRGGNWEESLKTGLDGFVHDGFGGSYEQALLSIGFDSFMDLILMNVLRAGFDVFEGDGFIEIYKPEGEGE